MTESTICRNIFIQFQIFCQIVLRQKYFVKLYFSSIFFAKLYFSSKSQEIFIKIGKSRLVLPLSPNKNQIIYLFTGNLDSLISFNSLNLESTINVHMKTENIGSLAANSKLLIPIIFFSLQR